MEEEAAVGKEEEVVEEEVVEEDDDDEVGDEEQEQVGVHQTELHLRQLMSLCRGRRNGRSPRLDTTIFGRVNGGSQPDKIAIISCLKLRGSSVTSRSTISTWYSMRPRSPTQTTQPAT